MGVFRGRVENCSALFTTNIVLIYYFAQPFGIEKGLIIVHRFGENQKL